MISNPLYGKRKKARGQCPNRLFITWLTEWRDEAAEKGWKSQYNYNKALQALKKFPLYLATGKDCKILENFGDKTCKMLDERLAQYIAEHGSLDAVSSSESENEPGKSAVVGKPSTHISSRSSGDHLKARTQTGTAVKVTNNSNKRTVHGVSDDSSEETTPEVPRKRQRSGGRGGREREYIPQYRSGPYALMRALYTNMQTPNARGFMTKAELVHAAQPLSDTSFTMPDPGSRYTAWSAMATLIKKHLVIKESSPAKYSLTDAGCELAHTLEAVQPDTQDDTVPFRLHQGAAAAGPISGSHPRLPPPSMPTLHASLPPDVRLQDRPGEDVDMLGMDKHSCESDTNQSGMRYWYVTEDGEEVMDKDQAVVNIDDEMCVGFLVKCNYSKLLQSGLRYKLDTSRPLGDDVYVYLHNDDTTNQAPVPVTDRLKKKKQSAEATKCLQTSGITRQDQLSHRKNGITDRTNNIAVTSLRPEETGSKTDISRASPILIDSEESSLESLSSLQGERKVKSQFTFKLTKAKPTSATLPCTSGMHSDNQTTKVTNMGSFNGILSAIETGVNLSTKPATITSISSMCRSSQLSEESQECSQESIKSLTSVSSFSSVQSLPPPDFSLQPGQFEIILCVDNQEFYGKSKGGGKSLLPELIKNGVTCDLRKLQVGDLLWVARNRQAPQPGQLGRGQGRELVLDYIIERKRMDDLVGSCIDGRFKEQKFRLKQCGLRSPMYLIEEYGSMQHFSLPETTLKQTIINTQVIDGFQLKRTKGTKETVAFLTVMTRYIQSLFGGKTLHATRLEDLKDVPYNINDTEHRLATFEEFNQGSVKTKALTIQEMFGRQLIQLHGMSAEKARAVIDIYPTPLHLLEEYEKCTTEKSRENLLGAIKCGKSARSLGVAQSKQIYQLYCTNRSLT